jgi:hypothetical protein
MHRKHQQLFVALTSLMRCSYVQFACVPLRFFLARAMVVC